MKHLFFPILLSTISASALYAGSATSPVAPEATATAPAATDWSGFYVGGMLAFETGDMTQQIIPFGVPQKYTLDSDKYGGFAGYNFQRGAMVYGGEIAYSTGDLNLTPLVGIVPFQQTENFLDAKARIGYAFKNVLVYGVAGGTWGEFYDNSGRAELSGFNYGAGAQMQFRNGMFVGLEYLIRDVSGTSGIRKESLE
ncbi:outer membrane protein [Profundibacter sp.]